MYDIVIPMKSGEFLNHYLTLKDHHLLIFPQEDGNGIGIIRCYNDDDQLDAPNDLPAEIFFSNNGLPSLLTWYQKGIETRKNDLPSHLTYFLESNQISYALWKIDGISTRDNDMPSLMVFEQNPRRVVTLVFEKDGENYRSGGRSSFIRFNKDGSMEDEDFTPIFIEKEDLPNRIFKTPVLPPIFPSPRQGKNNQFSPNTPTA